jgi:hypothetical protein
MVFFELRWNYSPLKEEAVLLPDGLFIYFCREARASLHTATGSGAHLQNFCSRCEPLGAHLGLATWHVEHIPAALQTATETCCVGKLFSSGKSYLANVEARRL